MEDYETLLRRQQGGGPFLSDREWRELLSARAAVASPDFRVNLGNGIPTVRQLSLQFGKEPPAEPPAEHRHRQADAFPLATWEQADQLLASRKAALDAGKAALSHEGIAAQLSTLPPKLPFNRPRVQRAEQVRNMALQARACDLLTLLKSDRDFWAGNGMYRLPTPTKARKYLGLGPDR